MPSPILARADALMQRRRQGGGPLDDVPVLTDTVEMDEDLPILDHPVPPTANQREFPAREEFAAELAHRVQEKLLAEIPHLIHVAVSELLEEYERKAQQEHAT